MGKVLTFKPRVLRQEEKKFSVVSDELIKVTEILTEFPLEVSDEMEIQLRLLQMTMYLNGLEGYVSWQLIESHKQDLMNVDLEELKNILLFSTGHGWQIKPAYYWALGDVLNYRLFGKPAK